MTTTTPHDPVPASKAADASYQPIPIPSTATSPLIVVASAAGLVTAGLLLAIAVPLLS